MSISTKQGDTGQTSLAGGQRVSKGDWRVEAYGTLDELISALGFARSICDEEEVCELTKTIQRELFSLIGALATCAESRTLPIPFDSQPVDALTEEVHRIEKMDGILRDWALPGEHAASGAYDVARTICRRAERNVVRLAESGEPLDPNVISYLNRLSDLLWLFGRVVERQAGKDSSLRNKEHNGPRWSRAW